jgi:DNA helicase HerA-like ATPase
MGELSDICRVFSVSQNVIQIEVLDANEFRNQTDRALTIGSYLKIADDDGHAVITVVQAYRIKDPAGTDPKSVSGLPVFLLDTQPIGFMDANGRFRRGGQQIAIPPTRVSLADANTLRAIFASGTDAEMHIGELVQEDCIAVPVNGDLFFGKHVAIVGSTGSGKSCAVAKVLQEGIRPSDDQGRRGVLNNSHIIVFDLHGEYSAAFPKGRVLTINNLKLPYWMMNAEELEEMFIMSDERNSHNQVSQFRRAVLENKKRHNPGISNVSYDSPVYFRLEEVFNYISNLNAEVIGKCDSEGCPVLAPDRRKVGKREEVYFNGIVSFVETSTSKADKASNGPFAGEFDRFILRLRNILDDERMSFLLKPRTEGGLEYKTQDLETLISDLMGYTEGDKGNITIIDLSGIPFEVLSLVVSLISRILFDVGFHLKKSGAAKGIGKEIPILAVYEEAHIYAPKSELAKYRSVTKAVERIAKEGRKYGVSLMIVSQRPSEISETIFSQCNSFVAMRLTNPADQQYVRRLLPDSVGGITDSLSTLEQREALVIGDSVPVPTIVRIGEITDTPDSHDIKVMTEWRGDWRAMPFSGVLEGMKRH